MRAEKKSNNPVHNQADPEVNQQAKVRQQGVAAMLSSQRQVRHEQEIDHIPRHDRCEGD